MGALQAPFPYFGGKSKAAPEVWQAFGPVDNYVEPFAGSAAMLLAAPEQHHGNPRPTIAPPIAKSYDESMAR